MFNHKRDTYIYWGMSVYGSVFIVLLGLYGSAEFVFSSTRGADSSYYLELAHNLRLGNGYFVPNSGRLEAQYTLFSIWPAGYPTVIYLVSLMTGTTIWWASKIVCILCFLGSVYVVRATFKDNYIVLLLLLLYYSPLRLFTPSMSDGPFLLVFLLLAKVTADVINQPRDGFDARVIAVGGCCIGLFLFRYIGVVSLAALGTLFIIDVYYKRYRRACLIVAIGVAVTALFAGYLLNNYLHSGFLTGQQRTPSHWSNFEAAKGAVWGVVRHGSPLIAVPLVFVAAMRNRDRRAAIANIRLSAIDVTSAVFLGAGVIYTTAIIILRWNYFFDGLSARLLMPGILPIMLAVVNVMLRHDVRFKRPMAVVLSVFVVLTPVYYAGKHVHLERPPITHPLKEVVGRYHAVPKGSIVVSIERYAKVTVGDLFVSFPNRHEPWETFLQSLDTKGRSTFVDITHRNELNAYHATVRAFMMRHTAGTVVQIK